MMRRRWLLGACAAALSAEQSDLRQEIQGVQSDLLHIGAWLATSPGSPTRQMLRTISPDRMREMEDAIDRLEADLPPLQSFLLPGGHATAAWAHVARTVCRRAERRVQSLAGEAGESGIESAGGVLPYLNRLSTYLFALARHCNRLQGVPDTTWKG